MAVIEVLKDSCVWLNTQVWLNDPIITSLSLGQQVAYWKVLLIMSIVADPEEASWTMSRGDLLGSLENQSRFDEGQTAASCLEGLVTAGLLIEEDNRIVSLYHHHVDLVRIVDPEQTGN